VSAEPSPKNRIRVEVQRDVCIGSGDCVDAAPGVFRLGDDDIAVVIDPDGAEVQEIVDAAGSCPIAAIFVYDEDGGYLYP
jgi:ferredoxin